eukprot:706943-Prorocentrum_minimum.AAC.1
MDHPDANGRSFINLKIRRSKGDLNSLLVSAWDRQLLRSVLSVHAHPLSIHAHPLIVHAPPLSVHYMRPSRSCRHRGRRVGERVRVPRHQRARGGGRRIVHAAAREDHPTARGARGGGRPVVGAGDGAHAADAALPPPLYRRAGIIIQRPTSRSGSCGGGPGDLPARTPQRAAVGPPGVGPRTLPRGGIPRGRPQIDPLCW